MAVGARVRGALRARGRRTGPTEDETAILEEEEREAEAEQGGQRAPPEGHVEVGSGCSSRRVAFAVLPDKYEPLGADGEPAQPAERKGRQRRRKLRKYGKNVGKVLQKGCCYVVLGLQTLANAYSSSLGVAASVSTLFR